MQEVRPGDNFSADFIFKTLSKVYSQAKSV